MLWSTQPSTAIDAIDDARSADDAPKRRNVMPHFHPFKKLPHDNGSIPQICFTAVGNAFLFAVMALLHAPENNLAT
jgi:hypothetical protein